MARLPEKITVRDAATGTPINGTADDLAFTSEPIAFKDVVPWATSMWFSSGHTFTGQQPQLTIEVSDDPDKTNESFQALPGGKDVNVPHSWEDLSSTWLWFRYVYDPKGADGNSNKFINHTQWVDG